MGANPQLSGSLPEGVFENFDTLFGNMLPKDAATIERLATSQANVDSKNYGGNEADVPPSFTGGYDGQYYTPDNIRVKFQNGRWTAY